MPGLVSSFRDGLYKIEQNLAPQFSQITAGILTKANSQPNNPYHIAAFFLLPGLTRYLLANKRFGKLSQFLKNIAAASCPSSYIVKQAVVWKGTLPSAERPHTAPTLVSMTRRVEALIRIHRVGAASRMVRKIEERLLHPENPPPVLNEQTDEAYRATMRALHPAAAEGDELPAVDLGLEPPAGTLRVKEDDIYKVIDGLDIATANGNDGWTYQLFKQLLGHRKLNDPGRVENQVPCTLLKQLVALFNRILSNSITGPSAAIFRSYRSLLILKDDTFDGSEHGHYRPINIASAPARILSRCVADSIRSTIAPLVQPFQFGGTKNGAVIRARLSQLNVDLGRGLLHFDLKNAFGNALRKPTFIKVREKCPAVASYLRFLHGSPAALCGRNGAHVHDIATGWPQGENLSSMLFEVGFHPTLEEIQVALTQLEDELLPDILSHLTAGERADPKHRCVITAYEDDLEISGHEQILIPAYPIVKAILIARKQCPNARKTVLFHRNADAYDVPEEIRVSTEGLISTGVPIGSPEYRAEAAARQVEAMQPPLASLSRLQKRTQATIVATSMNMQPVFLLQSLDLVSMREPILAFDRSISIALSQIAHSPSPIAQPPDLPFPLLSSLPRMLGGLGIQAYSGPLHERHVIVAMTKTVSHLANSPTTAFLLDATQNPLLWQRVRIGQGTDLEAIAELSPAAYDALTAENVAAETKKAIEKVQKHQQKELLHELASNDGTRHLAAYVLSAQGAVNTTFWFRFQPWNQAFFPDAHYTTQVRHVLGLPPIDQDPQAQIHCVCGKNFTFQTDPMHNADCHSNKFLVDFRHNKICDLLAALIKKLSPLTMVVREPVLGETAAHQERRADLSMRDGPTTTYIDVAVVNQSAKTYIETHAIRSHLFSERAAIAKENSKRNSVAQVVSPRLIPAGNFVPFVVDATGHFGPAAMSYLALLCHDRTRLKSQFINDVALECARHQANMMHRSAARLQDPAAL